MTKNEVEIELMTNKVENLNDGDGLEIYIKFRSIINGNISEDESMYTGNALLKSMKID